MINYVVTTRNKAGALEERAYTAENRADLFKQLAADGITAVRIAEGVPGKKPRKMSSGGGAKIPLKKVGLIATSLAALVAVVVIIMSLMGGEDEEFVKPEKEKRPKVVQGPSADVPAPRVVEGAKLEQKELPPQKIGETRDGYIKLPSGRLHKVRGVMTNAVSAVQNKGKYEIFDYHCENEIACLLFIQPGQGLVGTPRYRGRFTKEFLESLKTPIVINADDSEEDKALKRNVQLAKMELKAAHDRGEDIEQIMLDTRREYQELAAYRQELKNAFNDFKMKDNPTPQDEELFIKAANEMLEEKGIAPLELGPITRRKLLMMREEASRNQE